MCVNVCECVCVLSQVRPQAFKALVHFLSPAHAAQAVAPHLVLAVLGGSLDSRKKFLILSAGFLGHVLARIPFVQVSIVNASRIVARNMHQPMTLRVALG